MQVELFHANGQTDMTKLIFAFRNFANAPKNEAKGQYNVNSNSIIPLKLQLVFNITAERFDTKITR